MKVLLPLFALLPLLATDTPLLVVTPHERAVEEEAEEEAPVKAKPAPAAKAKPGSIAYGTIGAGRLGASAGFVSFEKCSTISRASSAGSAIPAGSPRSGHRPKWPTETPPLRAQR